jgi:hypothetical protein
MKIGIDKCYKNSTRQIRGILIAHWEQIKGILSIVEICSFDDESGIEINIRNNTKE